WWYSTDGGTNWNPLGLVSGASALLLAADANTRIYFQPAPAFTGTVANAITFRAWDQTSGGNGDAGVDTTTNGGTTAFSIAIDTASITVTPANAAPVANADAYTVAEDSTLTVDWWNTAWTRRRDITFSGNVFGGAENLADFPVLVALTSGNFNYGVAQADGGDLRFFDTDGTALAYEIESWTPGGTSYVWVRVPQIDTTGSDSIRMYYGNGAAADGWNPAAVWNSGYGMVQHLEETSGATSDSTANANNGVVNGVNQTAVGQIDGADSLDGNDFYTVADAASLDLTASMTLSSWVYLNPAAIDNDYHLIINKGTSGSNQNYFLGTFDDEITFGFHDGGTFVEFNTAGLNLAANTWHHIAGTFDNAANTAIVYLNGVAVHTDATATENPVANADALYIGRSQYDEYVNGRLDEVRIENVTRSAAWMHAQHLSQADTFVTIGGQQGPSAVGGVLGNDTDADGNPLTASYVLASGPSDGVLTFNSDGTFVYTPDPDFFGTDTFQYRANDGTVDSNVGTVTITVT
ncbi:MAG: DUF2341 domain-containing protein, partial [Gammaproteobacteria bacterium]